MNSLRRQRIGGLLLLAGVVLAMFMANSPLSMIYTSITDVEALRIVALFLFFLNIGIELRHEVRGGILSSFSRSATPIIAAVFGMALPVVIFSFANLGRSSAAGWPIVMSTDVAFALAALGLAGSWLPAQARAFVLAVAVVDDSLAILVLAFVFTASFNPIALTSLAAVLIGLAVAGLHRIRPQLELAVNFVALPAFGFLSAGVALSKLAGNIDWWLFASIAGAIILGKPLGVFLGSKFAVATKLGSLDPVLNFKLLRKIVIIFSLCFTVPLMMTELSFANSPALKATATIAVICTVFAMMVTSVLQLERAEKADWNR